MIHNYYANHISIAIMILCLHHIIGDVAAVIPARELNSRIVGGTRANATRYPYYTYLRAFTKSGKRWFCGGSLVNSDVVLTAAGCLFEYNDTVIRVSAYINYTQSIAVTWNLTEYVHVREAIAWNTHPKYETSNFDNPNNDVGLIFLDKPVSGVLPVKLNSDADLPADRDPVTAIGHGSVVDAETLGFPNYLDEVIVPIVSFEDCNDSNSYSGKVTDETMICAGLKSGGKDTCNGDGGGPLLVAGNSAAKDIQVGLTSWGEGCALKNFPGVYTRVSYFKQWIDTNICQQSKQKPKSCPKPKATRKPNKSMGPSRPSRKSKPTSSPIPKRI